MVGKLIPSLQELAQACMKANDDNLLDGIHYIIHLIM